MASNIARRIQAAIMERNAAICPALYGMNRAPGRVCARTHLRTENGAARWFRMYSNAAIADPVTDRIEPNIRALSGSRKGCAGVPEIIGLSSSADATVSSRHKLAVSRQPWHWQRRITAVRNVRAYPRHSLDDGSSLDGISPL